MSVVPAPVARLIQAFTKLPGIGEKTATRLAFYLTRADPSQSQVLAAALNALHEELRTCSVCCALSVTDPCDLCGNPARRTDALCVVEDSADLSAVERSGGFKGRYHVLHGTISPLDGIGPEDLRIRELLARLEDGTVREVVIATNPTSEGEATALYLANLIKRRGVRVTRIGHGLPMGGDVEYADTTTLEWALEGRREM